MSQKAKHLTGEIRFGELTEHLDGSKPLLGIDMEHLPDEILCSIGDVGPGIADEVDLAAEDGGEDGVLVL